VRIAIVTDTFTPQVNGVTMVCGRMVEFLRAAGHDVAVVAPRYPGHLSAASEGDLRVRSVPFPPYPDIRLSLPPYRAVRRYLDEFGPELVHALVEGPLGLVGRRYALRRGLPLVTSFHTDFPRYTRDYGVGWLEPLVWRWLLWFHGPAAVTHTPGQAVLEKLVQHGLVHAVLWGRGVDTALFNPAKRDRAWRRLLGVPEGAKLVVHVGRLAPEKNLDVLIDAWSAAHDELRSDAVFLLIGDGPVARDLESRTPWVRRIGFMKHEELARVYASSDICVLPSVTETLGLVALEAMASGLAVVAADAGGFRESIRDGHDGLLVPPHAPSAYAAAIVRLCRDREFREALSRNARHAAEARDVTAENAELIEGYGKVVGALGGRRAVATYA